MHLSKQALEKRRCYSLKNRIERVCFVSLYFAISCEQSDEFNSQFIYWTTIVGICRYVYITSQWPNKQHSRSTYIDIGCYFAMDFHTTHINNAWVNTKDAATEYIGQNSIQNIVGWCFQSSATSHLSAVGAVLENWMCRETFINISINRSLTLDATTMVQTVQCNAVVYE